MIHGLDPINIEDEDDVVDIGVTGNDDDKEEEDDEDDDGGAGGGKVSVADFFTVLLKEDILCTAISLLTLSETQRTQEE